jgi:NAD(P)-dependent dehydrogenase (short-subunit alcohol dehydrogenase family)
MTTWLITGCSSGLGRALASAVLAAGDSVAVTARSAETVRDLEKAHPDSALALPLDVTDLESVRAAVAAAEERFGAVDVLVNNAGYSYRAALEEGEDAGIRRLFDTNVHGVVTTAQAVLPGMRARRSGTIVTISSVAVHAGLPGGGFYAATKAAAESLTTSLRAEVAPLGIRAFTVEPGAFRTDFAGRSLVQSPVEIADYAGTSGKRRKEHDRSHGTQAGDPAKAAAAILAAVRHPAPPACLVLGSDGHALVAASLAARRAELDEWSALGQSTDF